VSNFELDLLPGLKGRWRARLCLAASIRNVALRFSISAAGVAALTQASSAPGLARRQRRKPQGVALVPPPNWSHGIRSPEIATRAGHVPDDGYRGGHGEDAGPSNPKSCRRSAAAPVFRMKEFTQLVNEARWSAVAFSLPHHVPVCSWSPPERRQARAKHPEVRIAVRGPVDHRCMAR